jgi:hypothetical protein
MGGITSNLARLLATQLTVAVAGLVVSVLSARVLGPAGRGEVAFGLQLSYTVSYLAAAGLDRAGAESLHSREVRNAVMLGVRGLMPAIRILLAAALVVIVGAGLLGSSWGFVVALALVHAAFGLIMRGVTTASAASGRVLPVDATRLAYAALSVGLGAGLFVAGVDRPLVWMGAMVVMLALPVGGVTWWASAAKERVGDEQTVERRFRHALRYHRLAATAQVIALRGDRLMLVPLAGSSELGYYMAVATLCELLIWPIQAGFELVLPRLHASEHLPTRLVRRILLGATVVMVVVTLPLVLVIEAAVVPLYGAEFEPSVSFVLPLTLAAVLYGVSRIGVGFGLARGDRRLRWIEPVTLAAWLPAFFLLTLAHGGLGAAWSKVGLFAVQAILIGGVVASAGDPKR